MSKKKKALDFSADQTVRNMPHPFFIKDLDFRYVYCNERFANTAGLSMESILGKLDADIHPEELAEMFEREDREVLQSGVEKTYLRDYVFKGRRRWFRTVKVPYRDDSGTITGVLGYIEDVTEQHETRRELEIKSLAIDTAAIAVRISGPDGMITYVNRAFLKLWREESEAAVLGKKVSDFYADYADFETVFTAIRKDDYWQGEIVSRRRDGSTFATVLSAGVTRDANGNIMNMLSTFVDISELKEQQQLEQDRDVAIRTNKAKSRFLSSISHELKTPLNAIMGFAQILEMDPALKTEHVDSVKEILTAGKNLSSLIGQILDFARIEDGEVDLSPDVLSCEQVVLESVVRVASLAKERNIQITTSFDRAPDATVFADHVRLVDILGNLISNAVKYNSESGTVEISVIPVDDRVRLSVTDNGYGIPEEKQTALFTSFDRLGQGLGTITGAGIGLALSKRLVEQMNGTIGFESAPDVGSTFWIELPQDEADESSLSRSWTRGNEK